MSNPNKKLKTDFGYIACSGDDQQRPNKRKLAVHPAKNLLDLNIDCLFEIFERADVMDLPNVAQSCEYMKTIAFDIFQRKFKILKLNFTEIISVKRAVQAIRLFETFGSIIIDLEIEFEPHQNGEDRRSVDILNAVITHCTSLRALSLASFYMPDTKIWFIRIRTLFERLVKLHLHNFFIRTDFWDDDDEQAVTTPNGNTINCFDNCTSLVQLTIYESYFFYEAIFQTTFPSLQHFIIEDIESSRFSSMDVFILHHPNLKTFSLSREDRHIPIAAANLRDIETFGFQFDYSDPSNTSVESLVQFRQLKELTCFGIGHEGNMSKLLKVLPKMQNCLEMLDLRYGSGNRNFIQVLNSMKKLKVVRLNEIDIKDTSNADLKNLLRATVIWE